jgi:ABC-2 type transport system permease protein/oleandomycin transport system permease protein
VSTISAITTPTPERARLTLSEPLADSRVMAARQLRKNLRRPTYVVFSFVEPVIFVLLFRFVFGGAINMGRVEYVDFLMPGIIVQTAVFGALLTGLGITEHLKAGVVDRFRSLPVAFSYVFSWISAWVGLSVKGPETARSAGFIWVFPLTFASSAFVPTATMPTVLRAFAQVNPVTLTVNAARALMNGHALGPALGTLVWLVGLLVVFVPPSVQAFRRA